VNLDAEEKGIFLLPAFLPACREEKNGYPSELTEKGGERYIGKGETERKKKGEADAALL